MERSHRSDDEEFYLPSLLGIQNGPEFLDKAASWESFSNPVRLHYRKGMEGRTPFEKLKGLGYNLPEEFAVFSPTIMGNPSGYSFAWDNDLATYRVSAGV